MSNEVQLQTERNIGIETSLLLARLTQDYGLSFEDAVSGIERALTRSYWGRLPDGYTGAIVPVD